MQATEREGGIAVQLAWILTLTTAWCPLCVSRRVTGNGITAGLSGRLCIRIVQVPSGV